MTTSTQILHHTTAFLTEILSNSDLRHHIFSTFRLKIHSSDQTNLINSLNIAADSLENTISSTTKNSSFPLAEKLLLPYHENSSFASFLLSLIYTLRHQHTAAALSLLDVFYIDPSSARSEISPILFDNLFLFHLLPVIQFLNDLRSRILSSLSPDLSSSTNYGRSRSIKGTRSLSRMSEDQTVKLKEIEREYEEVVNENCRVFAEYFKDILKDRDGNRSKSSPSLIFKRSSGEMKMEYDAEEKIKVDEIGFGNGRYNPIWVEEDQRSVEFYSSSSSNINSPPLYPQRVSPQFFINQIPTTRLNTSSTSNRDSESDSSSDNISSDSSSSESEHEIEENNRKLASFKPDQAQLQKQKQPMSAKSS